MTCPLDPVEPCGFEHVFVCLNFVYELRLTGARRSPFPAPRVRPETAADLLERTRERNLTSYLVTTPDGRLVGLVRRSELE